MTTNNILNVTYLRSPATEGNLVVTVSSCLSRSVSLRRFCGVTEVTEQLINPTPTVHTLLCSPQVFKHTHTHTYAGILMLQ